ncbi:unnamed protein product [Enterobius vermicularis]|uniref:SAS-6_N domain-containing protein n=1 Tax=Enterobius vermicularis TaxID=51028 RepID=A0A0N4VMK1_ENTVE|nr:unnamed protein product [Enterobius vermicularis]
MHGFGSRVSNLLVKMSKIVLHEHIRVDVLQDCSSSSLQSVQTWLGIYRLLGWEIHNVIGVADISIGHNSVHKLYDLRTPSIVIEPTQLTSLGQEYLDKLYNPVGFIELAKRCRIRTEGQLLILKIEARKRSEGEELYVSLSREDDPLFFYYRCVRKSDYDRMRREQNLDSEFNEFPAVIHEFLTDIKDSNESRLQGSFSNEKTRFRYE